jgi:hypothetical protein
MSFLPGVRLLFRIHLAALPPCSLIIHSAAHAPVPSRPVPSRPVPSRPAHAPGSTPPPAVAAAFSIPVVAVLYLWNEEEDFLLADLADQLLGMDPFAEFARRESFRAWLEQRAAQRPDASATSTVVATRDRPLLQAISAYSQEASDLYCSLPTDFHFDHREWAAFSGDVIHFRDNLHETPFDLFTSDLLSSLELAIYMPRVARTSFASAADEERPRAHQQHPLQEAIVVQKANMTLRGCEVGYTIRVYVV